MIDYDLLHRFRAVLILKDKKLPLCFDSYSKITGLDQFCIGVELHRRGFATNGANPYSFLLFGFGGAVKANEEEIVLINELINY